MLWFEQGLEWWRWLESIRCWLVILESAKDRVIGVDTSGQQVLSHVWYGITCLLIRDAVGSVPCLDE
jgi:hypothetical protein